MEMNIEKKFKVVDSVFFNGEIDYLQFRFTELNNMVDFFIILEITGENEKTSLFESNIEKFELRKDKIIHIKSTNPSEETISDMFEKHELNEKNNLKVVPIKLSQIHDLSVCLSSLNLNFDDIILISNIDEIPILPKSEVLQSFLSFEPVVFLQKNFLWNKGFVKQENHLGSLCFQYSHFITNNHISHIFTENSSREITLNFTPINSGFKFELFQNLENSVHSIASKYGHDDLEKINSIVSNSRNELIYYDFKTLLNPMSLVKYDGDLPVYVDMLDSQEIGRVLPKKHLVVVGIDASQNIDTDNFETVSIISHTTSIDTEPYKQVSDNVKIHYIQIPNINYYDVLIEDNNLKNFQKMYVLNEIKSVLISLHPLDIDIFEFYFAGKTISYPWSIIKDNFIYDLLHK